MATDNSRACAFSIASMKRLRSGLPSRIAASTELSITISPVSRVRRSREFRLCCVCQVQAGWRSVRRWLPTRLPGIAPAGHDAPAPVAHAAPGPRPRSWSWSWSRRSAWPVLRPGVQLQYCEYSAPFHCIYIQLLQCNTSAMITPGTLHYAGAVDGGNLICMLPGLPVQLLIMKRALISAACHCRRGRAARR